MGVVGRGVGFWLGAQGRPLLDSQFVQSFSEALQSLAELRLRRPPATQPPGLPVLKLLHQLNFLEEKGPVCPTLNMHVVFTRRPAQRPVVLQYMVMVLFAGGWCAGQGTKVPLVRPPPHLVSYG